MTYLRIVTTLTLLGLAACNDPTPVVQDVVRPVKTVTVQPQANVTRLSQTGEIRPVEEISLGFRLAGRVLKRSVDVGDTVNAGDVVALLDPSDAEHQLKSAQAQLDSAISNERVAQANLKRLQQLLPGGAVSQAQVEQGQSSFDAAVSSRKSAEATLATAKDQLSFTKLTASQAGIVAAVTANQGEVVAAGQEIVRVAAVSGKDAVFHVAESLLHHPAPNAVVDVHLLSNPAIKAQGTVRDISPVADPVTRTYRVRVSLQNPPAELGFGASVEGSIELPSSGDVRLPSHALTRIGDKPAVYVVQPNKTLARKEVVVAGYQAQDVLIKAGLQPGDVVVVAGVQKLRPGQTVSLLQE